MRIYFGPPGTGKTLFAVRDAVRLADPGWTPSEPDKFATEAFDRFWKIGERVEFVTFSPSDQYETVVEAVRPYLELADATANAATPQGGQDTPATEQKSLAYQYWVGPVLRIIRRARDHPTEQHVLIIDEINRADISQVLGPLIAAIEADKRLGSIFPVPFNVRYDREASHEWVPANLHVIGTMNSADRNIALVDVALRRRFEFARLNPDDSLVSEWTTDAAVAERLSPRRLLRVLNLRISELLGQDFTIGHSYLMSGTTNAAVVQAFATHILPLLQEYFYGDDTALLLMVSEHPEDDPAQDRIFDITRTEAADLNEIFGERIGGTAAAYLSGSGDTTPFRLKVRDAFWDSAADPPRPADPQSAARALRKIYSHEGPAAEADEAVPGVEPAAPDQAPES